jgi:hypothetical protein
MFELLRKLIEILESDLTSKEKLQWFEQQLEDDEVNATELVIFGKLLQKIGTLLESKGKSQVLDLVREKESISLFGTKISYVSSDQYNFLPDPILDKYEELVEQKKEELKNMQQSVKTRKEHLINENKALKTKPKEHIRIQI